MISTSLFPIFKLLATEQENSDGEGSVQEEEAKSINLLKMVKSYDKKIEELNSTIDHLKEDVQKLTDKKSNRVTVNKKKLTLRVQVGSKRYEIKLPEDSISLATGIADDDDLEQSRKNAMENATSATTLATLMG